MKQIGESFCRIVLRAVCWGTVRCIVVFNIFIPESLSGSISEFVFIMQCFSWSCWRDICFAGDGMRQVFWLRAGEICCNYSLMEPFTRNDSQSNCYFPFVFYGSVGWYFILIALNEIMLCGNNRFLLPVNTLFQSSTLSTYTAIFILFVIFFNIICSVNEEEDSGLRYMRAEKLQQISFQYNC